MIDVVLCLLLLIFSMIIFLDQRIISKKTSELEAANIALAESRAKLDAEREKCTSLENTERVLREKFEYLSAVALKNNNESFINLAKNSFAGLTKEAGTDIKVILNPIFEVLKSFDAKITTLELQRNTAYTELAQQIDFANKSSLLLQKETNNLVNALRKPDVRGRWGEMQLRKTVEIAGMTDYIDFIEQGNVSSDAGNLRPDMVVNLPNARQIVIDSKAPLATYLEAIDAKTPDESERCMLRYTEHIRRHIIQLSSKAYWQQFAVTPEFVVLFLPGENFFSDALRYDPSLIEFSVEKKVIPATPTTLIALLKTVAYGWKQDKIANEAKAIVDNGHELYKRVKMFLEHFDKVGKTLGDSVKIYNEAWSSLQSRLIPQARRFEQLSKIDDAMEVKNFVNNQPHSLSIEETQQSL